MRLTELMCCTIALIASTTAALAIDAGDRCEAKKNTIAGKYAQCRQNAVAKAIKKPPATPATPGPTPTPNYTKCDAKFADKWMKAETSGGGMCPTTVDIASMQARITAHADAVADCLAGGTCPLFTCGNGTIDADEDCDQADLNGKTCVTEGFVGGCLTCGAGCAFDTSGCWNDRFVDNADGTITDNETGLMWEKKTELDGAGNLANPHDADNGYRCAGNCSIGGSPCQPTAPAAALCTAKSDHVSDCHECTGGEGSCNSTNTIWALAAELNNTNFAGHADWRVPTLAELTSLIDYADATAPVVDVKFHGASCGAGCMNIMNAACSCTQTAGPIGTSGPYWSASTQAADQSNEWMVNFGIGSVNWYNRTNDFYTRAVRSGP